MEAANKDLLLKCEYTSLKPTGALILRTDKLRINQLSPEAYKWYLSYLQALDAKDVQGYSAFLSNNCVMQSNNNSPVQGKAAIIDSLSH